MQNWSLNGLPITEKYMNGHILRIANIWMGMVFMLREYMNGGVYQTPATVPHPIVPLETLYTVRLAIVLSVFRIMAFCYKIVIELTQNSERLIFL
jgi:hypothetical protein